MSLGSDTGLRGLEMARGFAWADSQVLANILKNSGNVDDEKNYWVTKLGWISDEEAIKFLDEQIKNDCDPDYYIPEYLSEKITILKRLGKNEESKKIQKDLDKLRKSIKEKEEMEE